MVSFMIQYLESHLLKSPTLHLLEVCPSAEPTVKARGIGLHFFEGRNSRKFMDIIYHWHRLSLPPPSPTKKGREEYK